jgi:ABC-type uncharacterized transport system substrate-binding protein
MLSLRRLLLAFTLLLPAAAAAHPHIFIEHHIQVVFDKSGPVALRMVWSFDELYSSTLRTDYTDTPKGAITPADVDSLRVKHFAPVTNKHFFASAAINGEPVALDQFSEFSAEFIDDKAIYHFTVPLAPVKPPDKPLAKNTLELSVFDKEYYIDFELTAEHPVEVIGGEALGAKCSASTVSRDTIGWGNVDADLVTCTYAGPAS